MKRDDELIRQLLFRYEADADYLIFAPDGNAQPGEPEHFERFHWYLMKDEGLICDVGRQTLRLTSKGLDFLESIRTDAAWERAKENVANVGGLALGVLVDVARAYLKQEVSQKLGVNI